MDEKDLTFPLYFQVEKAEYSTNGYLTGDCIDGGRDCRSLSGTSASVSLEVRAESDVPVTSIKFEGFAFIQAGDRIMAYVPKYSKREGKDTGIILGDEIVHEVIYAEREFNSVERVSRIEKVDSQGKVLASFEGLK